MATDRTKPTLPGEHGQLVTEDRRPTPWYRRWFERVDRQVERIEGIALSAQEAAEANAGAGYPDIQTQLPLRRYGPDSAPVLALDADFAAAALAGGQTVLIQQEVEAPEPWPQGRIQENTGVVPGSYTNADITVGPDGRILSASNGAGGGSGSASIGLVSQIANLPFVL